MEAKTERLREKIETLRGQMRRMDPIREELKTAPDEQISETDPDARSMISQAKGTGVVGYNVQAAVDTQAAPDRDPRGDQRRQRPGAADQDGHGST